MPRAGSSLFTYKILKRQQFDRVINQLDVLEMLIELITFFRRVFDYSNVYSRRIMDRLRSTKWKAEKRQKKKKNKLDVEFLGQRLR